MLVKTRAEKSKLAILVIKLCYKIFQIFLLSEELASIILFFEYSSLDFLCLRAILYLIKLGVAMLNLGARSIYYIFRNRDKILDPGFVNPDLTALWILSLLLIMSSDVHPNPGPPSVNQNFSSGFLSFCNWNLNTLSKDNFSRVSLLEAHNTIFKYDIISLCETSLNDEATVPENALPGYIYHPLNNPDGSKNGGVGIFYKDSLPLKIRPDLSFDECLVTELIFGYKKIFFTVFYRNPKNDANSIGFSDYLVNFENLCKSIQGEKPYAMFFAGDANGHTQAWYPEGDTNAVGTKLDELFSSLNLQQIINEPTHFFRDDCNPSCIDIILTDQPNLVMNSGVRSSLDPTVKHQITFCKLNFKIPPPPKYKRKIWHYNRAQSEQIKKSIFEFPWSEQLRKVSSKSQSQVAPRLLPGCSQVALLNETILNITSNFIPSTEKPFAPLTLPGSTKI